MNNQMTEKRVVFDAGGVLFADGSKALMEMISEYGSGNAEEIEKHYRGNIHKEFMRGEITEDEFWAQILEFAKVDSTDRDTIRKRFLEEVLFNLPGVDGLHDWSKRAELWVLSNHRHEWLNQKLEESGVNDLFHTTIISSSIGARKPEAAAFDHLLASEKPTIYVDDKQTNLDVASSMGYDTLLADADGNWHKALDEWLDS